MVYLLTFLEGIMTFISPCILPMFPVYLSYFAGNTTTDDLQDSPDSKKKRFSPVLRNVLGFTLGFTVVFVILGAFAGTVGWFLVKHKTIVNIITGGIVIIFGLHFAGILKINLLNKSAQMEFKQRKLGFFSSVLFGIVFSIGWTPCVGAFLGTALSMAANRGSAIEGTILLFIYSLGLSIPFILSAIFIEKLKSTFNFIKKHYKTINLVAGILLVIIGILMIFNLFDIIAGKLTFALDSLGDWIKGLFTKG